MSGRTNYTWKHTVILKPNGFPKMMRGRVCVGLRRFLNLPLAELEPVFVSPMQQRVWKMIADNETTKSIALSLGLSIKTVEYHRLKLCERLGMNGTAALTKLAIKIHVTDLKQGITS